MCVCVCVCVCVCARACVGVLTAGFWLAGCLYMLNNILALKVVMTGTYLVSSMNQTATVTGRDGVIK